MAFGYETFGDTEVGSAMGRILAEKSGVSDMIALARHGIPPVQDIGVKLSRLGITLTDHEKQMVGRWVREVMEQNSWEMDGGKTRRCSTESQFVRGRIYIDPDLKKSA